MTLEITFVKIAMRNVRVNALDQEQGIVQNANISEMDPIV